MYLFRYLFLFLSTITALELSAQSATVKELREEEKVLTYYYLYPSTLRMLNLKKDPAFDKLVKPIRRLGIFSMDDEKFGLNDLKNAASKLIEEEQYETYMEMDGPSNNLFVLGRPDKEFTCVLSQMDSVYYIVEVQGTINLMQLSELYNSISTSDSTLSTGFVDVFDILQKDNEYKRKRQRREEKRKERERKRKEEEQMKKDSLQAIESKLEVNTEQEGDAPTEQ